MMSHLVKVATLSELPPGTGRQVQVEGRPVAIFNVGGTVYAIDGACSHRGGPLGDGELTGSVVTCPWHGARFDVRTGAVLAPPATRNAETHRVVLDGGAIAVELP
jgi:nitrite reductase/ring-hydroxylating ferredoxin subunit